MPASTETIPPKTPTPGGAPRTPSPVFVKAKVCLVGEGSVGKTSLARRFVLDQFDDRYLPTMGAKVTKKEVVLSPDDTRVVLTVWDIMGEPTLRELLKEGYFRGCHGVMAVGDLTRPDTIAALVDWVASVRRVSGHVPAIVLANKADLASSPGAARELRDFVRLLPGRTWRTSAKTGANVEAAFMDIAREIARAAMVQRGADPPRREHRLEVEGT